LTQGKRRSLQPLHACEPFLTLVSLLREAGLCPGKRAVLRVIVVVMDEEQVCVSVVSTVIAHWSFLAEKFSLRSCSLLLNAGDVRYL
jgi:hypothetical protein